MTTPATANMDTETLLVPITGTGMGLAFTVDTRSKVCRVFPITGEDPGADDAFELHTVLDFVKETGEVTRSYALKEVDPVSAETYGLPLGGNQTQAEIVIRGYYAWNKVEATTIATGVQGLTGYEKVL